MSINRVNAIWRIFFFFGLLDRAIAALTETERFYSAAVVVVLFTVTGLMPFSFLGYTAATETGAGVTDTVLTIIGFEGRVAVVAMVAGILLSFVVTTALASSITASGAS